MVGRGLGALTPVMLKVGVDEADDEKRQRVLTDWTDWLLARCD